MKISILIQFLTKKISYLELKEVITDEVRYYKKQLQKKGASAPVDVIEDATILVNKQHLQTLCETYLSGVIDNYEMYYIADALLLSSFNSENSIVKFEGESLMDEFEFLSELSYDNKLTSETVKKILQRIEYGNVSNSHLEG